jgi:SAM-dependent methyltransferase
MHKPRTWHHGLVAEWWAEFVTEGHEIEYFRQFVERGQPALDAGCGTGRLLLPWLRAGLDVDGCDVSADMLALCRQRARREGLEPTLLVQPLHDLAPPRRYRTIVVCGAFGLGSTHAQDQEALRRFHQCLEPGGTLVLDNGVPYANEHLWQRWTKEGRRGLPEAWPPQGERKRAADGSEYELRGRTLDADPLEQTLVLELRVEKWSAAASRETEEQTLTMRMYFREELLLMLERAGFASVDVRGDHNDEEPTADDEFLVFIARA